MNDELLEGKKARYRCKESAALPRPKCMRER